jgi:hypothetical protein
MHPWKAGREGTESGPESLLKSHHGSASCSDRASDYLHLQRWQSMLPILVYSVEPCAENHRLPNVDYGNYLRRFMPTDLQRCPVFDAKCNVFLV